MRKKISDFIDKIKPKKVPKKPSYAIFKTRKNTEEAINSVRRSEEMMNEAILEFLESNEHSNKYDSFVDYLKQENPELLAEIPREKIRDLYDKKYEAYLEHHDKNEFGLDHKYVNDQLRKLFYTFRSSSASDGSFLYAWKTSETNGIEKYQKVTESELYKGIEPIERVLCEYILSAGDPKIDNILAQSKTLVELGPGGANKLLMHLRKYCKNENIREYLQQKLIKLIDLNTEGYVEIKNKLNKLANAQITEGMEGDFLNKESSVYKSDLPCYFMFGRTIGNFSLKEIRGLLNNMKSGNPLKKTHAMITYFTAPDKKKLSTERYADEVQKIKATYGDPDKNNPFYNASANTAMKDFVLSGFTALGMDVSKLEYVVEYEEAKYGSPARIKLGAKFKERMYMVDKLGDRFEREKGDTIRAIQSARFTEDEFKTLAKESGYKIITQQSDRGVGVAMLESKLGINDKYKKQRNRALAGLIGTTLVTGGIANHEHQKNKDINEKIIAHEEKLDKNQSTVNFERIKKINAIKQNVCNHLMRWYDTGSLESNDILPDISKYLLHDDAQAWLDTLYKNQHDEVAIYNFLTHFVNEAFYKTMFEQGSKDLNVIPFLQGYEDTFITTLQYNGSIKEGYNEKEGVYYMIQAPGRLRNTEKISGLENIDLTSGYMMKRTGKVDSIHIDKFMYDREINTGMDFVELSRSEPDADGKITIKRFFFDDNQEKMIKKIKEGTVDEIVFENTHKETSRRGSSNLVVNKDLLIAAFLNNNPFFKIIREKYDKKYGDQRSYMSRGKYADMEYQKIQTAILYDMYKNHGLNPSSTGEYTNKILDDYVDRFHAKYTKYKTSADALINNFQNKTNPSFTANTFPSNKSDSKSKGFSPGTFKK